MADLPAAECYRLLRSLSIGRLVFTEDALPSIRLVNYQLVRGEVVLRLGPSRWVSRLDGAVVAFEADQVDEQTHTGWSVIATGRARIETDIDRLAELLSPMTRPWAPGRRDTVLCIDVQTITGLGIKIAA
ncbi:pyridoxamine 5'-phosphate oxidase family protein [Labedaea rhizosphaerae]|nr:pyridoxamine 5'-phosphate oxidase family protein [Labedaea rhizosphaerae]